MKKKTWEQKSQGLPLTIQHGIDMLRCGRVFEVGDWSFFFEGPRQQGNVVWTRKDKAHGDKLTLRSLQTVLDRAFAK